MVAGWHMHVSEDPVAIGSANDLSPARRQAIT